MARYGCAGCGVLDAVDADVMEEMMDDEKFDVRKCAESLLRTLRGRPPSRENMAAIARDEFIKAYELVIALKDLNLRMGSPKMMNGLDWKQVQAEAMERAYFAAQSWVDVMEEKDRNQ